MNGSTSAFSDRHVALGDTDHSRQVLGTGPLGWEHVVLPGRLLQMHWVTQRLGQILRGGYTLEPMIHVPLSDAVRYRFGRGWIGLSAEDIPRAARLNADSVRDQPAARGRPHALAAIGRHRRGTTVAMACGFNHMGRFSTMYRQRFGESPSTTVRRRPAS